MHLCFLICQGQIQVGKPEVGDDKFEAVVDSSNTTFFTSLRFNDIFEN
jgi:hypothetical protein